MPESYTSSKRKQAFSPNLYAADYFVNPAKAVSNLFFRISRFFLENGRPCGSYFFFTTAGIPLPFVCFYSWSRALLRVLHPAIVVRYLPAHQTSEKNESVRRALFTMYAGNVTVVRLELGCPPSLHPSFPTSLYLSLSLPPPSPSPTPFLPSLPPSVMPPFSVPYVRSTPTRRSPKRWTSCRRCLLGQPTCTVR